MMTQKMVKLDSAGLKNNQLLMQASPKGRVIILISKNLKMVMKKEDKMATKTDVVEAEEVEEEVAEAEAIMRIEAVTMKTEVAIEVAVEVEEIVEIVGTEVVEAIEEVVEVATEADLMMVQGHSEKGENRWILTPTTESSSPMTKTSI